MYAWMGVCFGRERSVWSVLGFWLHCTPKQDWVFIFDTVRESSVWSVLGFVFDKKCVRVTSEMEVGYRVVTKWSTCG